MKSKTTLEKLRIGVFMGGKSIEREVSFNSGRTVCDHIDTSMYEVVPIFQTEFGDLYILPWYFLHRGKIADFKNRLDTEAKKIIWDDLKNYVDFAYISLHGRFAEDGTIQGFFEILGIPYLGTKVFGSSLGINKSKQRDVLKMNKIDVARGITFTAKQIQNFKQDYFVKKLQENNLNYPVIVKPECEGSSLGINVVKNDKQLVTALKFASCCDERLQQNVLIEEKLEGMEFVCVCLEKQIGQKDQDKKEWFAMPVTQVITEDKSSFYDYEQKYMPGRASKITPPKCSDQIHKKIQQTCLKATMVLNFSTISRIDGFVTKDNKIVLIDPNSLTGLGPATFLWHQAAEIGMSHTQLINYLIRTELQNYGILAVENKKEKKNISMKIDKKKKRVAVLLGGNTNEREVSLESGRNICYKLPPEKYEVLPVFVDDNLQLYKLDQRLLIQNSTREISELVTKDLKINWSDLPKICDFVFIGLHGGAGENGEIQGTLEMLGLPYNGSGVLASSLCIDKYKTAQFLKSKGFDVPQSILIEKHDWNKLKTEESRQEFLEKNLKQFEFPVILKPHDDGCSVGVEKIKNNKELAKSINLFFEKFDKTTAMIEESICGIELTCGVIGNDEVTVLPPSMVVSKSDVLSIEEKFLPGAGENLTPAPIAKRSLSLIQKKLKDVYLAIGCRGYVRIDFFLTKGKTHSSVLRTDLDTIFSAPASHQESLRVDGEKEKVVILEINSLPGMTPATCIFHQAAEIGIKPMEFVDKIVELGFEQHRFTRALTRRTSLR